MTEIKAYHFTSDTLRDGSHIPPIGQWLEHSGPLQLCKTGLHASERLLDALAYAPGLTLHCVTLSGEISRGRDKLVATRRRIDSSRQVPMRTIVRFALESACLAAWAAGLYLPDLLVALDAADREDWAAAGVAAGAAARDAAWAAAGAAAGAAARDAAWAAARDAAGAAAGAAARDAAWAAAGAAAGDALESRAISLFIGACLSA